MDGSHWNEITFFPGEDAEALKAEYVRLRAKYPDRSPQEVTQHIFKNLQQPGRYIQAAALWHIDIDLLERISRQELMGDPVPDCTKADLVRRGLVVADTASADKDKIAAIRVVAELQGFISKSGDAGGGGAATSNDAMAELAARLPN